MAVTIITMSMPIITVRVIMVSIIIFIFIISIIIIIITANTKTKHNNNNSNYSTLHSLLFIMYNGRLSVCEYGGMDCRLIWDDYSNCWDSRPGHRGLGGIGEHLGTLDSSLLL